jgi:hypothetical protein
MLPGLSSRQKASDYINELTFILAELDKNFNI